MSKTPENNDLDQDLQIPPRFDADNLDNLVDTLFSTDGDALVKEELQLTADPRANDVAPLLPGMTHTTHSGSTNDAFIQSNLGRNREHVFRPYGFNDEPMNAFGLNGDYQLGYGSNIGDNVIHPMLEGPLMDSQYGSSLIPGIHVEATAGRFGMFDDHLHYDDIELVPKSEYATYTRYARARRVSIMKHRRASRVSPLPEMSNASNLSSVVASVIASSSSEGEKSQDETPSSNPSNVEVSTAAPGPSRRGRKKGGMPHEERRIKNRASVQLCRQRKRERIFTVEREDALYTHEHNILRTRLFANIDEVDAQVKAAGITNETYETLLNEIRQSIQFRADPGED